MLDQFTWAECCLYLIDPVTAAQDSLFSSRMPLPIPTHLNSMIVFQVWCPPQPRHCLRPLQCPHCIGTGSKCKFGIPSISRVYHFEHSPTRSSRGSAISNVLQRFVSSIDTLPSPLKKTVLLTTSEQTKRKTPPFIVALKEATLPIKPSAYSDPVALTGVLLEGEFPSLFQNRVAPFAWEKSSTTQPAKIAVFADGNLAENQTDKGEPLALGYDKWTNNLYGNKLFLQNIIHYLMGEELVTTAIKNRSNGIFDRVLLNENKRTLQFIALWSPLLFLLFLGGGLRLFKQFNRQ